jgi:hypothetical protein
MVLEVTEEERGSPVSISEMSTYAVSAAEDVSPVRPPWKIKLID